MEKISLTFINELSFTRPEGLEPSTLGFGDQRSTS
jgi:hypothetical protein